MSNEKTIVSILGNIGVGKTTLVERLKKRIPQANFIKEPVDQWLNIKNSETGQNILDIFYKDKKRWSYTFENVAFITRLELLVEALDKSNKLIIMDGSLATDKNVFAEMLHEDGMIDPLEWEAYNLWHKFYETYIKKNNIRYIYLKVDPEIAKQRIIKRDRKEETEVDISYLRNLNEHFDKLIKNDKNMSINVFDCNYDEDSDQYNNMIEQIVQLLTN